MRSYLFLLASLPAAICSGQTFTGSGGSIPDNGPSISYTISVSGLGQSALDTSNFGVERVCINAVHPWVSDLEFSLIAPDGTMVPLSIGNGGDGDDYTNTCFTQDAPQSITTASAPFSGTFRPEGQLGLVNNGQNGNGTWTLLVLDNYPFADAGSLLNWSITFGNDPAGYFAFMASDLPIVVINTNGETIPNDPKIMADMGIIWNGPGVRNQLTDPFGHYSGKIGIELRGASSSTFPKKGFGLETWDLNGNSINVPLFNMPTENDWVLSAGYNDKTLLRNAFTYATSRAVGQYAPRTMHVDVVLNGAYLGVYTFCEKIKRDDGRVPISNLLPVDISGDELTGGYIIKVDKVNGSGGGGWYSLLPPAFAPGGSEVYIQYEEPAADEIMPQQATYIEAYVDSFETALLSPAPSDPLTGYPHFIDVTSFADHLLMTELVKNGDGLRISTYYHKEKNSNGGKLNAGPMWDLDISMGNGDYCDIWRTDGWVHRFGEVCGGDGYQVSGWWEALMDDAYFRQQLRCRWEALKTGPLSVASLHARVDSLALHLDESQGFNFTVWPILGSYVWPNYYIAENYAGEVDTLKWFLAERWAWMDGNLPVASGPCDLTNIADRSVRSTDLRAYFDQEDLVASWSHGTAIGTLEVMDVQGRTVATTPVPPEATTLRIPMRTAPPGVYLIRLREGAGGARVIKAE
jgi:subtilisin-like proprotein convertase family protein